MSRKPPHNMNTPSKLSKYYYKTLWGIFFVALALGLALRIFLKNYLTDVQTGFYLQQSHWLVSVFTALLLGTAVLLPLLNFLRRGGADYQVRNTNALLSIVGLLAGAALVYYVLTGLPDPLGPVNPDTNLRFVAGMRMVHYLLGVLAGLSLLVSSLLTLLRKSTPSLILLLPAIWQLVLLFGRFSGYYAILYIADFHLAILFMFFSVLFYLGHARTLSDLGRVDGRNYVLSAGLCMALCGALLVIPNYVYMLLYSSIMPADLLSMPESLYVSVASIYGLLFAAQYTKSMKNV